MRLPSTTSKLIALQEATNVELKMRLEEIFKRYRSVAFAGRNRRVACLYGRIPGLLRDREFAFIALCISGSAMSPHWRVFRLSQLQDENLLTDEHASLAKVFCTLRTRDIVSRAREVMGGNGILLQYDVARFVADAEAIYSYEGTKEINSLIVGRAITGISAFV